MTSACPPLANQWAGVITLETAANIPGWQFLEKETFPEPGFIIAHPDPSDAGHCAIIDYDGGGIGAGVSGFVSKNFPYFYDGTSRYRKYLP